METIIGLLFILLPVIFKLIGKKLENAGTATPPDTAGSSDVGSWVKEAIDEVEPEVHPHPQLRKIMESPRISIKLKIYISTHPRVQFPRMARPQVLQW